MGTKRVSQQEQLTDAFENIRESLLEMDVVYWAEKYLTLDGSAFRLNGNGWKPLAEIYRYIALKAVEKNSKPVVVLKGRQLGISTMCAVLELYFSTSGLYGTNGKPPIRIMHAFPQLELAYAYSKTKLNTMIQTAKPATGIMRKGNRTPSVLELKLDQSIEANNSLQFKQFIGGNHIWIDSLGLTGDRIRGRTVDIMFLDEFQDAKNQAVTNSLKILTQSQYGPVGKGVQVFFGTPKQSGTDFWRMWKKTSQQYYFLGCVYCGEHFPLHTPNSDDWEEVWVRDFIVKCSKCQKEQDKLEATERGKWVSLSEDPNPEYIGFHLSQLYIPRFSKEKILAEKPDKSPINSTRAYHNEVIGEFWNGSSSPISIDELENKCADRGRMFSTGFAPSKTKKIVLGADWGDLTDRGDLGAQFAEKQQGTSYSCVVICSIDNGGILDVEYTTRLKKNDPATKREVINELFRRYSIDLAVSDIGYSGDLTYDLQKAHGDRFLASRACDKINGKIKFNSDIFPKEIAFERNYYIEQVFSVMREGKIRFPYGDYEKISWLLTHITGLEQKTSLDRNGEMKTRYVRGSVPIDGFMALMNAYIGYLFLTTKGFANKQIRPDLLPNAKNEIPILLGHIPRMNGLKR